MTKDFLQTLLRVTYAFAIAAALGVPVGIVLGANESIYRSLEFVIDFFRSTPATAMFPLFLLLFGLGEFSKISVAAFAAWLVIVFNVAYGVMNARQTRILAARSMGAGDAAHLQGRHLLRDAAADLRRACAPPSPSRSSSSSWRRCSSARSTAWVTASSMPRSPTQLTDMYGSILVAGAMGYGANLALPRDREGVRPLVRAMSRRFQSLSTADGDVR